MRWILALAFVAAFVLSLILTALIRRIALRLGFLDRPGGYRQHEKVTPFGGGLAIVLASGLTIVGCAALAYLWKLYPSILPISGELARYIEGAADTLPLLLYVLGGGLCIAFFGMWDDIRPFSAIPKLIVQIIIVTVLVVSSRIHLSAFIPVYWIQVVLTVGWIVLLTNSFNLLDNADGLSGTVAFICGAALMILAVQTGQLFVAGYVLALMGAVLGFLYFNFPPARIFMGDAGSMFIGYMLATSTVVADFLVHKPESANPLLPILMPLIIFAVPLYDTVSVVVIRRRHKKPLLLGDRNHLSHRLLRLGMSPRCMLLTIGLLTIATALGVTVPYGSPTWLICVPAVQALAIIIVIMELELASVKIEHEEPGSPPAGSDNAGSGGPG